MKSWKSLTVFLALVAITSGIGAFTYPDAWYVHINKPGFTPPNAVFPPVWTLLYVLMAVAAWRVYRRVGLDRAVVLWAFQLAANAVWSPIFFRAHAIGWALFDILLLLVLVAATTCLFFMRDRVAGIMMSPYVAWVTYASVLTFAILRLN